MRPLYLLLAGIGVMWFITSGRAAHLWTLLTEQSSSTGTPAPAPVPVPQSSPVW